MKILILIFFLTIFNNSIGQLVDSECKESFELNGFETNSNFNYNAQVAILTKNNYKVSVTNGEIRLKAGNVIVLKPSTYIQSSSVFLARIETCVICDLTFSYPKFFTPNGDSYNDYWKIDWANLTDFSTITIFDRYGKLIKTLNSPNEYWDGTYNQNEIFSTDYWFKLIYTDCNGIRKEYQSHFSLKR
ncbi:T9SS type B sorting domain-containing protein [Flavobacterium sp. SM2513]|uniref:T9SS type B sorting domain-containing protein n=1 Tax=Flavobacterium sp. SM2513 TaxID=3424766 RepID=UPI003D7F2589